MILPEFVLPSRINQCWEYSGMDSLELCTDKKWFKQYPHTINYHYNSRGFRDQEWPESINELQNAVWCIGDSFTVGLGSPVEHTWPTILQQELNARTINVSMDGASNQWIARKTCEILKVIKPKILVIQWSYIYRVENSDTKLSDEDRRQKYNESTLKSTDAELLDQLKELVELVEQNKYNTKVIHSFIPGFSFSTTASDDWNKLKGPDWPDIPTGINKFLTLPAFVQEELKMFDKYYVFLKYAELLSSMKFVVPEFTKQDLARDGHHYDIITARKFANQVNQLVLQA